MNLTNRSRRRAPGWLGCVGALMCWAASAPATAATLTQVPDAVFLVGGGVFQNGQSDNLGPAAKQVLSDYWISGGCPLATNPADYSRCDQLHFGLDTYANETCDPTVDRVVAPAEDSGQAVENALMALPGEAGTSYCIDSAYRPLDQALYADRALELPGGPNAPLAVRQTWWSRPRLTLLVLSDMPQTANGQPDQRVLNSLRAACNLYHGGTPPGTYPPMPTWVMLARQYNSAAAPFARLLAAAGGTGRCCYGTDCELDENTIDVCKFIQTQTDAQIRADLAAGKYRCGAGNQFYNTGAMTFGSRPKGTLPGIRCSLVGQNHGDHCSGNGRRATNILGIFSCVRQLPQGQSADTTTIWYCPDSQPGNCEKLRKGIDFQCVDTDPPCSLFVITNAKDQNGNNRCNAVSSGTATIVTSFCPDAGKPCSVPGATGRCAVGTYVCNNGVETCQARFGPMPEICDGLDDDCDGVTDDLATSWKHFGGSGLSQTYQELSCNGHDACVCPNGRDAYAGTDFSSYLAGWSGTCHCAAALNAPRPASPASAKPTAPAPTNTTALSCAASPAPAKTAGVGLLGLALFFLSAEVRRRNRRTPTG